MESSAAALRSFHYSFGVLSHVRSLPGKTGLVSLHHYKKATSSNIRVQGLPYGGNLLSPSERTRVAEISCIESSDSAVSTKTNVSSECIGSVPISVEKRPLEGATFPSGFQALLLEVCDETQIAELKLKVGNFEMHVKRNVRATEVPAPVIASPVTTPPIPAEPVKKSSSGVSPPSAPKPSSERAAPFMNVTFGKSSKIEALEASGSSGYVLVSSPTVGSFQKGRTVKGKKQAPSCKEGDLIKEGQVIGWLDQFGTELPVKSDVSGEVLKLLIDDGEAVGYGDPLLAVLPSFPGVGVQ
ncbi:uncharacterized protein LOC115673022 isoform X1 [Syzygium oleosum]|uniref:uncharacterized protein LOC115673022 isoform X1 n=1 Tax=Syzygium oleosum TaxID=219896 RepID=UPI0011D1E0B8|nr:uncharacterized protein LOC115673022 isoform X1 [Syzygium oleosum]